MKFELSANDRRYLRAAVGWLELGNHLAANEELEQVRPRLRAHPDILQIRIKIYLAAGNWKMVAEIGSALQKLQPQKSFGVLHQAFALRMLNKPARACDILLDAAEKFPKDWQLAYQVACCCAALGDFENARNWAKHTFEFCPDEVKLQALDDPALETIWVDVAEI